MAKKKYPIVTVRRGRTEYWSEGPCTGCGKRMTRNEPRVVRETQWSHFRGDDEVEFFHEECFDLPAAEIQPGPKPE